MQNRRDFLGWAATGAAGLLLPTPARPRVFDMGRGMPRGGPIPRMSRDGFRVGDVVEFYDGATARVVSVGVLATFDRSLTIPELKMPWRIRRAPIIGRT